MLKKMPLRLRLTVLSILLLTLCCAGLTIILNFSANRMANVIEATALTPAHPIAPNTDPAAYNPAISMVPLTSSENSKAQIARTQFLYQSIFYMMLVVAVGGGLTYYLSGKALTPLQELSSQMKNRTVHNLSEDVKVPESHDEIAELTYSFNEMSKKLDESFAMQKRFSQSAAHELRTPLTVLKTKVDVFKKKKEHTAQEYDDLLSVITTHTNRLSHLVKDLLNLSNMDALEYNEQVEIKSLVTDVSEELSCLSKSKNITLTVTGEERTVHGNKSLLHRAFYNLVENAIKYNLEDGHVDIKIAYTENHSIITIADTGIGIPDEMRELVFEPFFRVDKSRSRQMGGAGLGLSTVKAIVDKHHGKITISENTTGGTTFKVIL